MRLQRIPPLDPTERCFLALLAAPVSGPGGTASAGAPDSANGIKTVSEISAPVHEPGWSWPLLYNLAERHRLAGYLYTRREGARWWHQCPRSVRDDFRQHHLQTTFRNTLYQRELVRVLAAMNAEDIVPLLLKGAALNFAVYQDAGERTHADIDLLIEHDKIDAVDGIMRALGYEVDESHQSQEFYRRHHFHLIYRHREHRWSCFEIHWDLCVQAMDSALPIAGILQRARGRTLNQQRVRMMSPDDLLLHLCQHAGLNAFSLLCQIRDIHAVITHTGWDLDPAAFWGRARQARLLTAAAAGVQLARFFGASARLEVILAEQPVLRHGSAVQALLRPETIVRRRLVVSAAGSRAIALQRRDRLSDRWRYLWRLVRPSGSDRGLDGHPLATWESTQERRFLWPGLGLIPRAAAYTLLAQVGWEIVPRPVKASTVILQHEPNRG